MTIYVAAIFSWLFLISLLVSFFSAFYFKIIVDLQKSWRDDTSSYTFPAAFPNVNIFLRFYLFIFRKRGREGEKEGEKHWCVRKTVRCLSYAHKRGPGLQPRHVPWPGIEPATFQLAGWRSVHWATPDRAPLTLTSLITTAHYHNQEINMGTILLTK